ncbi:hypothetical protein F5X99DRAFT_49042 [Biscogniauxia marginata]|nr:hypothetical protein F5X99DRAFT_49042 [Biscogniauxia marginata]
MSAVDIFMSSPRPANVDTVLVGSSSPNLPSLDEMLTRSPKKPLLGSGNQAAPIPFGAPTSFTSASALLRDVPEIDIDTEQVTDSPPRKPKDSQGRQRIVALEQMSKDQAELPIVIESPSPKDKPWQKFKSKKPMSEHRQAPLLENGVNIPNPKKPARTKLETVSRHFTARGDESQCQDKGKRKTGKDCGTRQQDSGVTTSSSEPAMARRNDWTPPRATDHIAFGLDPETRELLSSVDEAAVSEDVFRKLFDTYGRKHDTQPGESGQQPQTEVLKKRKHIELVSTTNDDGQQQRKASLSKVTTTKKRTRTITELATSRYILPVQPELEIAGPSTEDSLLNYFDSDGALKGIVEHQATVMSLKKGKTKPAKEPTKSKRKKKPGTENNPILLSPNSALKQSSNQDFVFGTSSQLVREESPTTLKELQMAIRASNQVDSDPFADSDSQGLWHASARDVDGDLMEIELLDVEPGPVMAQKSLQDPSPLSDTFVDIEDILTSPVTADTASKMLPPGPEMARSLQSQINTTTLPPEISRAEPAKNATENSRPDYDLFTDAQLSKQIASYGFKPVKKRQAMVALLDQCWASKSQVSSLMHSKSISTSANAQSPPKKQPVATSTSAKTVRPRGRPKKTVEKNSTGARSPKARTPTKARPKKTISKTIEIADSDTEEMKSPSSVSSSGHIFSSPPPLDLSIEDEGDMSLATAPSDQQAQLFKHITKAVTSIPRSEDPLNPSWHEKMLLFDPVILEDLASWLNSGELSRVGYDGEVDPYDVKKWCESKSVICLWKQNSRGKSRRRY